MHTKTRYSLFYLATYLFLTGTGLLAAPEWTLRLLLSNTHYDTVFVRFVGSFMIGLSVVVIQIIRHRVEVLYPTTVVVRLFFLACITWFYASTRDPVFLVMLGVVGLGVLLTTTGLILERRKP